MLAAVHPTFSWLNKLDRSGGKLMSGDNAVVTGGSLGVCGAGDETGVAGDC